MAESEALKFIHIAVSLDFIKPNQIGDSLIIWKNLQQKGENVPIQEILLQKGLLTKEQITKIQESLAAAPDIEEDNRSEKPPSSINAPAFSRSHEFPSGYTFGRYQILEVLGRGGMGIVYKAHDSILDRDIAIKMLLSVQQTDVERFSREARATAKLRHPNIVNVYDTGCHEGYDFLTMDLLRGIPLSNLISQNTLTIAECVNLLQKIGDAVHYAHAHGIIHRDLKPSNVIVEANNQPKVMDFGLAKIMGSNEQLSQSGVMIGTLLYMPPEQADGRIKDIDIRSDVYALGAIMYQMLTGSPPFTGETFGEILAKILAKDPAPPSSVNPEIPKTLDRICLKALSKEKERRYQDAASFVRDLQLFKDDKEIEDKESEKKDKENIPVKEDKEVEDKESEKKDKENIPVKDSKSGKDSKEIKDSKSGKDSKDDKTSPEGKIRHIKAAKRLRHPRQKQNTYLVVLFVLLFVAIIAVLILQTGGTAKENVDKVELACTTGFPHLVGKPLAVKVTGLAHGKILPNADFEISLVGKGTIQKKEATGLYEITPSAEGKLKIVAQEIVTGIEGNFVMEIVPKPVQPANEQNQKDPSWLRNSTSKPSSVQTPDIDSQAKDILAGLIQGISEENISLRWKALCRFPPHLLSTPTGQKVKSEREEIVKKIQKKMDALGLNFDTIRRQNRWSELSKLSENFLLSREEVAFVKEIADANPDVKHQLQTLESSYKSLCEAYEKSRKAENKVYQEYVEFKKNDIPKLIAQREWNTARDGLKKMLEISADSDKALEIKQTLTEVLEMQALFLGLKDELSSRKNSDDPISVALLNGKFLRGKVIKIEEEQFSIQDHTKKVHSIPYFQIKTQYLTKLLPQPTKNKDAIFYYFGKLLWYEGQKEDAVAFLNKSAKSGFSLANDVLKQIEAEIQEESAKEAEEKAKDAKDAKETKDAPKVPDAPETNLNKAPDAIAAKTKRYYNNDLYFSIALPVSWEKKEHFQNYSILAINSEDTNKEYKANVSVTGEVFRFQIDRKEYQEILRKNWKKNLLEYTEYDVNTTKLGRKKAGVIVASYKLKLPKKEICVKALFYVITKEDRAYSIACRAEESSFDSQRAYLEEIANSFKMLEK